MAEHKPPTQQQQEGHVEAPPRPGRVSVPPVDIFETDQALWLRADLPGVRAASIELTVDNQVLAIEGPVSPEAPGATYQRRFSLSDAIDTAHIHARLTDGVLELELPKVESAQPHRITVQTSA